MPTALDRKPADRDALRRCAALLDTVGRSSSHATVALHALAAADALATAGCEPAQRTLARDDATALRDALTVFATISPDALAVEAVLDAAEHTLLAHLAAR